MSDSREIVRMLATKVLAAAIAMCSGVIVARVLGASGKGEYALVILVSFTTMSVISLNIGDTAIFFFNKRKVDLGIILGTNLCLIVVLSAGACGVLGFLWKMDWLPWKELTSERFAFVVILVPIVFMQFHLLDLLRCVKRFKTFSTVLISQALFYLVGVLVLVFLLDWHVRGALIAGSLSLLLCLPVGLVPILRGNRPRLRVDARYAREGVAYGVKGHLGNMFQKMNTRLDQFFVSPYCGSAMLGNYSVAVTLSELVWYIPDSIAVVILPRIAGSDAGNARRTAALSIRMNMWLTLAVLAFFYLSARLLVSVLYGSAFSHAVDAMYYLLPGVFFVGYSKVVSRYLSGVGRPELNTLTAFISSVATVVLCVVLIPRYGIIGAAAASSIAYFIRAVCDILIFRRISGCSFREMMVPNREDVVVIRNLLGMRNPLAR